MPRASKTGIKGLYKAAGRYHIDLRFEDPRTGQHRRYVEHLPRGVALAAAKERARRLINSAYDGELTERDPDLPTMLYDCFDRYLDWSKQNRPRTYKDRQHRVRMLKKHVPDMSICDASQIAIERFKRARAADGVKPATINRAVALWKHFIGRSLVEGWISDVTAKAARNVSMLKEPPGRVRYLGDDERRVLLAALRPDVRDVVITALLTGMRRGEILGLKKASVDLPTRLIRLTETKTNKARFIPIHDELVDVLRAASERSSSEYVFANSAGRPLTHRIAALFRRTVAKLGIADLHFHDLRHDFATRLRRSGVGLDVIAALLGHSTLAMTQRYAHLGREDLAAAVRGLGASPKTAPTTHASSERSESPERSRR